MNLAPRIEAALNEAIFQLFTTTTAHVRLVVSNVFMCSMIKKHISFMQKHKNKKEIPTKYQDQGKHTETKCTNPVPVAVLLIALSTSLHSPSGTTPCTLLQFLLSL
jgi:hypothetical protein